MPDATAASWAARSRSWHGSPPTPGRRGSRRGGRGAGARGSRLQVELAQLEYTMPRLTGLWKHLERQAGGIGTRGPGETQLEVDRRRGREGIAPPRPGVQGVDAEREA